MFSVRICSYLLRLTNPVINAVCLIVYCYIKTFAFVFYFHQLTLSFCTSLHSMPENNNLAKSKNCKVEALFVIDDENAHGGVMRNIQDRCGKITLKIMACCICFVYFFGISLLTLFLN